MPSYPRRSAKQGFSCTTLGDALSKLLEHTALRVRQAVRSPATLRMQEFHVRAILVDLPPAMAVAEIDHELVAGVAERWGQTLALRTVAKRLSTLRRALRLCVVRGDLDRLPPLPEIGLPVWRPRVRVLRTFEEYRRLVMALPVRRGEWVSLAIFSCQRPGDTERMRWSDVDLGSPTPWMMIRSTKTRRPDPIRVKIPTPLVSVLARRFERLEEAGATPRPTDLLVDPWPGVSKLLPVVCVRIGLPPMSAMDLRHTGISWMVRRTGLTRAAQEWGGWSDYNMMTRYYAHALPAQLDQAADELASMAEPANDNGEGE